MPKKKLTNSDNSKQQTGGQFDQPIKEKINVSDSIEKISHQLDELKNTTNLDILCKSQHELQEKIKQLTNYLDDLKGKLNKDTKKDIIEELTDKEYEKLLNELDNMNDLDIDNIEEQVDIFLIFKSKVDKCKQYLEKKKLEIVEIK